MAHYARLGVNNVVVQVDIVKNSIITTSGGIEKDALAFEHLAGQFGAGMWVKCSYNTQGGVHGLGGKPFRANYPGGEYDQDDPWYYDIQYDIFRKGRPKDEDGDICTSWTLNTSKGVWVPPLESPSLTRTEVEADPPKRYRWDESLYQSDNAKGWIEV